jgi:arginine/lysine/ornithine decarboxylase
MALETLEGIEKIDGFKIVRKKPDEMSWDEFDKIRDEFPINITERMNTISFKIQNGPIKEVGINGCQVDTMIETAKIIIEKLNEKYPCEQNYQAIGCLNSAVGWLRLRRLDRMEREVEGTSNP